MIVCRVASEPEALSRPPRKPQKLLNVQALRAIAALGVLATHLHDTEILFASGLGVADHTLRELSQHASATVLSETLSLGQYGVDLFFVISGFIMMHVILSAPISRRRSLTFLVDRITRIYPLYWIATALVLALAWLGLFRFWSPPHWGNLWKNLLLLPTGDLPVLGVAWTLIHEMYFYAMVALSLLVFGQRFIRGIFIWMLFWLAGWLAGLDRSNAQAAIIFSPLTLEFFSGVLVCLLSRKSRPRAEIAAAAIFFLGLGAAAFVFMQDQGLLGTGSIIRGGLFAASFGALLLLAVRLEQNRSRVAPRALVAIGSASYALYLFHFPLLHAMGTLWNRIMLASYPDREALSGVVFDNFILLAISAAVVMSLSMKLSQLLEYRLTGALRARLARAAFLAPA